MGRAASHITLECALQTHPNIALIGEEVNTLLLEIYLWCICFLFLGYPMPIYSLVMTMYSENHMDGT